MKIRAIRKTDRAQVSGLYKAVAGSVKGIARRPEEITDTWVFSLFNKPEGYLVGVVAVTENEEGDEVVIGVAHAEKNELTSYNHILENFTVIVCPKHQKSGLGRQLGWNFLNFVAQNCSDIRRLEMEVQKDLMHHDTYISAGFIKEGEIKERVRNTDGTFSDSIMLVWINPNFKF